MAADTTLTCRDCGQHFTFTSGEQDFYASRGYSEPSRCPDCRAARKAERDAGGGGYGSYGGAVAAAAVADRARCLPPRARAVATKPRCHSSPAATSRCIARRASSSAAAAAVVAAASRRRLRRPRAVLTVHVEPREGESFDQFLRRFKTSMDKSGILREYKRKRYFKSNGELQREKAKAAARRRTKRFRGPDHHVQCTMTDETAAYASASRRGVDAVENRSSGQACATRVPQACPG